LKDVNASNKRVVLKKMLESYDMKQQKARQLRVALSTWTLLLRDWHLRHSKVQIVFLMWKQLLNEQNVQLLFLRNRTKRKILRQKFVFWKKKTQKKKQQQTHFHFLERAPLIRIQRQNKNSSFVGCLPHLSLLEIEKETTPGMGMGRQMNFAAYRHNGLMVQRRLAKIRTIQTRRRQRLCALSLLFRTLRRYQKRLLKVFFWIWFSQMKQQVSKTFANCISLSTASNALNGKIDISSALTHLLLNELELSQCISRLENQQKVLKILFLITKNQQKLHLRRAFEHLLQLVRLSKRRLLFPHSPVARKMHPLSFGNRNQRHGKRSVVGLEVFAPVAPLTRKTRQPTSPTAARSKAFGVRLLSCLQRRWFNKWKALYIHLATFEEEEKQEKLLQALRQQQQQQQQQKRIPRPCFS
jgi:hypothetical protein